LKDWINFGKIYFGILGLDLGLGLGSVALALHVTDLGLGLDTFSLVNIPGLTMRVNVKLP